MRLIFNVWDWSSFLKPPNSPEDCWFVAVSIRGSSRDNHLVRWAKAELNTSPAPRPETSEIFCHFWWSQDLKPAAHPLWLWDGADPGHRNSFWFFLRKLAEVQSRKANNPATFQMPIQFITQGEQWTSGWFDLYYWERNSRDQDNNLNFWSHNLFMALVQLWYSHHNKSDEKMLDRGSWSAARGSNGKSVQHLLRPLDS